MNIPVRIGMDTSKSVFQLHGVDEKDVVVVCSPASPAMMNSGACCEHPASTDRVNSLTVATLFWEVVVHDRCPVRSAGWRTSGAALSLYLLSFVCLVMFIARR